MDIKELCKELSALREELARQPLDKQRISEITDRLLDTEIPEMTYPARKLRSICSECRYLDSNAQENESRVLTIRGDINLLLDAL